MDPMMGALSFHPRLIDYRSPLPVFVDLAAVNNNATTRTENQTTAQHHNQTAGGHANQTTSSQPRTVNLTENTVVRHGGRARILGQ